MFLRYFKISFRLQFEESASREDLLGAEETQVISWLLTPSWFMLTLDNLSMVQAKGFFFKPSLKNKTTVFSVGSRGDVLGQVH